METESKRGTRETESKRGTWETESQRRIREMVNKRDSDATDWLEKTRQKDRKRRNGRGTTERDSNNKTNPDRY